MSRFRTPYPGYDVLSKWDTPSYNDITRDVLRRRLTQIPARRFFSPAEWACLEALCDTVIPQEERADPVPIAPWIDEALHAGRGSGTRYEALGDSREAWRRGLACLDGEARRATGKPFAEAGADARASILRAADSGTVASDWGDLPPQRFLRNIALKTIVSIYYAHPAGQSEIGFGGPASHRGYVRMGKNRLDDWEAPLGRWEEEP